MEHRGAGERCQNCGQLTARDFQAERAGEIPQQPILPQMTLSREPTLGEQVKRGDFKLYESARAAGAFD